MSTCRVDEPIDSRPCRLCGATESDECRIAVAADKYFAGSRAHVNRLIADCDVAIKPEREDLRDPRLWKGIHWRWFFEEGRS